MQDKLIEAEIDDGILGVVLVLNDAGVKTFSSCQGGGYGWGHGYLRPIVCFDGDDSEGERAEKIATDAGYQVFQVQRVWYTRDGERVGPFWEMEFVAGAACRAPKDRAAVRAHDAGTDEGLRKEARIAGLVEAADLCAKMYHPNAEAHIRHHIASLEDVVSHDAESASIAPPLTCACCGNETPTLRSVGIMPDMCEPCAKHAESAQLDAEPPAEPVEDVPPGYVKLEDVEKAIRAVWKEHYHSQAVWSKEEFLSKLMARLAPKPSPLSTGYTGGIMPEAYGVRCNRCGVFVDDQITHDQWHATLFPKTGGAK